MLRKKKQKTTTLLEGKKRRWKKPLEEPQISGLPLLGWTNMQYMLHVQKRTTNQVCGSKRRLSWPRHGARATQPPKGLSP